MSEQVVAVTYGCAVDPLMKYIFRLLAEGHLSFNFDDDQSKSESRYLTVFPEGAD
jgi:hypothetical protein